MNRGWQLSLSFLHIIIFAPKPMSKLIKSFVLFAVMIAAVGCSGQPQRVKAVAMVPKKNSAAQASAPNAVDTLLAEGAKVLKVDGKEKMILFYARHFIGVPYVAHTLDRSKEEGLVVNLDELDCTTYLENVMALSLCTLRGQATFADFKAMLQQLRYRGGRLSYENRLHYYQWWVSDNEKKGLVRQVSEPNPPFTAVQRIETTYMTTHASAYTMLQGRPDRVKALRQLESQTDGLRVCYIPKSRIDNTRLMRQTIHDGDIIAITTNKKGLDTTHLGIAVWHADGLHLLNASALKKNGNRVVEAQETLRHYLDQRSWNPGIRVARILP